MVPAIQGSNSWTAALRPSIKSQFYTQSYMTPTRLTIFKYKECQVEERFLKGGDLFHMCSFWRVSLKSCWWWWKAVVEESTKKKGDAIATLSALAVDMTLVLPPLSCFGLPKDR